MLKIALFICGGAVLRFFILAILFHELQTGMPGELKKLSHLLSQEYEMDAWRTWEQGLLRS